MFQKLVSHNDDIRCLVDKGYAVAFDSNHLIIRDIPYLNESQQLQIGAIVTKLVFKDEVHVTQHDHQIQFAGAVPHGLNGSPIPNLGGGPTHIKLSEASEDVVVQRSFSNKPKPANRFIDFFDKIDSYVGIISGPAIELHQANPYTCRVVRSGEADSIFKFQDTLTSRAGITELSRKFEDDVVAVIGLGGTGAYVLDLLVKMPAREIRGFDRDPYHVHNTFRSPGRLDPIELGQSKAKVYGSRYHNFRTGLSVHERFIDASCTEDLDGVTFAFVCVDKGSSRAAIFDLLISMKIPFIDVGMGLNRKRGPINGMLRTTYYSADHAQKVRDKGLAEVVDNPDDLYKANIQIGELNALNACLAIIKFKQLRGFYFEKHPNYNLLFEIADLKVVAASDVDED